MKLKDLKAIINSLPEEDMDLDVCVNVLTEYILDTIPIGAIEVNGDEVHVILERGIK